jgi:hypothetical protein
MGGGIWRDSRVTGAGAFATGKIWMVFEAARRDVSPILTRRSPASFKMTQRMTFVRVIGTVCVCVVVGVLRWSRLV